MDNKEEAKKKKRHIPTYEEKEAYNEFLETKKNRIKLLKYVKTLTK